MNLDSIIDDIIDLTEGDLEKMDEIITGGKNNEDDTSNK